LSPPVLPRWARAADYLTFLIVIIALVVAASGGMKIRYYEWRFTMTSPYRLLVWAVAIALVRHFFVREQPIYRQLPADIARWYRSTPFRAALAAFVGTRPAIFLVGYLAIFLFGYPPDMPPQEYRHFPNEVVSLPLRWDAGWYLRVAKNGYEYSHQTGSTGQQNIVFFPAFPVTMRVVGLLLAGGETALLFAGTFVSLSAFFGALVYVYLLARDHLDDEQSRGALWLLAAYPFALFFGAIYTESFFLLGATGAFYHARRGEFVRSGLWALMVGLTRPNGFLLSVPLAVLALSPWLPPWLVRAERGDAERTDRTSHARWASVAPAIAAAAMAVVGMLIYSVFIWSLTGNPLAWMSGHLAWGRRYTGLTTIIVDRYNWLAGAGLYAYVSEVPIDMLNALGVVFVLVAAWPVARRLGLAYGVFILINILPPLAQGGMLSAGRFSSVMFPAFIWLAGAVPARHRAGWIASFAAIQALNAALFYTWRPMF
jgi:hypothetical protein